MSLFGSNSRLESSCLWHGGPEGRSCAAAGGTPGSGSLLEHVLQPGAGPAGPHPPAHTCRGAQGPEARTPRWGGQVPSCRCGGHPGKCEPQTDRAVCSVQVCPVGLGRRACAPVRTASQSAGTLTHVHARSHIHMHTHTYMCTHSHIHAHTHTYMCMHTHTCARMLTHACVRTLTHTCVRTLTHTCAHSHTHAWGTSHVRGHLGAPPAGPLLLFPGSSEGRGGRRTWGQGPV